MTIFPKDNQIKVNYGQWGFRRSNGSVHKGADISTATAPYTGRATVAGYVEFAGMIAKASGDPTWEWGWHVRIFEGQTDKVRRKGTRRHVFAHNEKNLVQSGQIVKAGQEILVMGNTGNAAYDNQGKHVHYQVDEWSGSAWANLNPTTWCGGTNTAGKIWNGETGGDDIVLPMSSEPIKMWFGPMTGADYNKFYDALREKQIPYTETGGKFSTTIKVSIGDQKSLMLLATADNAAIPYGPICGNVSGGIAQAQYAKVVAEREDAMKQAAAAASRESTTKQRIAQGLTHIQQARKILEG